MLRNKLTFANVMSFLALFVALSAGSYAAIRLPANSVGPKQLKKSSVTGAKLAANAVDGSKVKDGSLTGADLNVGSLGKVPSAASADSAGTAGSAGSAPIARVKVVTAGGTSAASGGGGTPTVSEGVATCDQGLVVVGGGASVSNQTDQLVNDSFPVGNTWHAHILNYGTATADYSVYAICAPAAATG